MLLELTNTSANLDTGQAAIANGAIWLEPDDTADAKTWVESRFGAWDTLFAPTDSLSWRGLLDLPYAVGEQLRGGVREVGATLSLGGAPTRVVLRASDVSRPPARIGSMVVGRSRVGDVRGSWLVTVAGADLPPRELGGTQPASAETSHLESGTLDPAGEHQLSGWTAQLASGDPESFVIVVNDVIRRMRRVEEDGDHFTAAARGHAGAAAQSLLIVLAEFEGEIEPRGADAAARSADTLLAELAAIGVSLADPQLGLLAKAGVLILKHFWERRTAR